MVLQWLINKCWLLSTLFRATFSCSRNMSEHEEQQLSWISVYFTHQLSLAKLLQDVNDVKLLDPEKISRRSRISFSNCFCEKITRVEVPEVISAEQRCFIVLTFFSADSENMKNISADQLFQSWSALIFSEPALFRTEKFSAVSELNSAVVMANFWARVLCSLAAEDACFRMRMTLGVVLIRSLVFHDCVPECSRNGFGVRPYLWVQEKFVWFSQSAQNAGLCPAELLGQFFRDSAFNLLRNLCDIFLVNFRNRRVSWLAVPRMFLLCFSCNGCQLSFVSQCCHLFEEQMLRSCEDWISFYLWINLRW